MLDEAYPYRIRRNGFKIVLHILVNMPDVSQAQGIIHSLIHTATDWVLSQFGKERKKASNRYREFVHAGVKETSPFKAVRGQLFLGEEGFIEKIKHLMRGRERLKEIPRVQRYITRPPLDEIFKHKDKKPKGEAIYEAHVRYGYTLKDIAEYIGVHYTTVSRAVKRMEIKYEK